MSALYEELLCWDKATQVILRTLSRGDLSILKGAVAHSRCELDSQAEEREKPYFEPGIMTFMTGTASPIHAAYVHFTERGWMQGQAVAPEFLEKMPDSREFSMTPKGARLMGQCVAHFLANNPLPPAPGEAV